MQKREIILDWKYIDSLSVFIAYFGCFSTIDKKTIITCEDVNKNMFLRLKNDDSLDRFNSYIYDIANPINESIWEEDYVLIHILNSDILRENFWFDISEYHAKRVLENYKNRVPEDEKGIKHLEFILQVAKRKIRNNTMFDILMGIILSHKKIALRLS